MNLNTIPYHSYEKGLPQEGNFILGQRRGDNIFVYQAFNDRIADYAIKNQKFGGPDYSFNRMTWIKPNFLWMMYRSGWAEKDVNQNRILAIEMTFKGFEELLTEGVLTSYDKSFGDEKTWRENLDNSNVRIQWDPDHGYKGEKLKRRAVQIGIKNDALEKFNNEFVQSIQDITPFVKEQKANTDAKKEWFFVIDENIIEVNDSLKKKFSIPDRFYSSFVSKLISEFEATKSVSAANFEKLLSNNNHQERKEFVEYIKNYQHIELSRYLLQTAIAYRKGELGSCGCMCEDLLMFSYFVSKNKTTTDFDLVMAAKVADFDTWCGFDGEMVFYTLGYQQTKDYITANKDALISNLDGFIEETAEYFLKSFDEEYLYNDINSRALVSVAGTYSNKMKITKLDSNQIPDFRKLIEIFNVVFGNQEEIPGDDHLKRLLSNDDFMVFVIRADDKVVGGLTIYVLQRYNGIKPIAYIYDVGVAPQYQGQGFGKTLIAEVSPK